MRAGNGRAAVAGQPPYRRHVTKCRNQLRTSSRVSADFCHRSSLCPCCVRGQRKRALFSPRVSREALESPVRDAEENAPQKGTLPPLPTRTKEIFQVSLEPIKARMLLMRRIIPKISAHMACDLDFGQYPLLRTRATSSTGPPQTPLHTSPSPPKSYAGVSA